jgi:hypothetical protein
MKKLILTLMFFASFYLVSFSQNSGEIKGRVFDKITNQSIPGATVWIKSGNKIYGNNTDKDGRFTIKPLPSGIYDINITFVGYDTVTIASISVTPEKITFVPDAYMAEYISDLPPTIINGRKLIDPEQTGRIDIISKEIEAIPGNTDLTKLIVLMESSIYRSDDGELYFRGSRQGDAVYYIDGVKSMDSQMNVPTGSVGSLTIYTGGVPAKYGDFTGGCVVIETKSYFTMQH